MSQGLGHIQAAIDRLRDRTITLDETLAFLDDRRWSGAGVLQLAIVRAFLLARDAGVPPPQPLIDALVAVVQNPRHDVRRSRDFDFCTSPAAWACTALLQLEDSTACAAGEALCEAFGHALKWRVNILIERWDQFIEESDLPR